MIDRLLPLAAAVLLVVVSVQLVRVKREHAVVLAELDENTRSFVGPPALAELPVELPWGAVTVRELCGQGTAAVLYFSRRDCPACGRLESEWRAAAAHGGGGGRFIRLHLDGPAGGAGRTSTGEEGTVNPGDVIRLAGLRQVPGMVALDRECAVAAAGSGERAARLVLRFATGAP
jgi:hypothetical protein